jgi:hypothetical protein
MNRLKVRVKSHLDNTPINLLSIEVAKSLYVYSYSIHTCLLERTISREKFEICPQKNISGPNGHGPLDFVIDLRQTLVKKDDFVKGVA